MREAARRAQRAEAGRSTSLPQCPLRSPGPSPSPHSPGVPAAQRAPPSCTPLAGSHEPPGRYVRVNGTRLELEGETFRFAGFNAQQVCAAAVPAGMAAEREPLPAAAPWHLNFSTPCSGRSPHPVPQALAWAASGQPKLEADLASLFQHAQQLGLGVTRVWATLCAPPSSTSTLSWRQR